MRNDAKRGFARVLRSRMTDAERRLWRALRRHQLGGHRFRRQVPIGPYVVDFACLELKLVIEADGGQHLDSALDALRTRRLARNGYRVLRFWDDDVLLRTEIVLDAIVRALAGSPHPDPPP